MIMQTILGPTLRDLKEYTGRNKLPGSCLMKIGMQAMNTFQYAHSRGLIIYDITSSSIAIGNTKETLNKIFFFDFTSSFKSSSEDLLKNVLKDMILFALVLMDLNGVEFTSMNKMNEDSHIEEAFEYLLGKWDENYIEVHYFTCF